MEEESTEDIDEALKYAAESHRKAQGRKRQIIGEFIDELLDARLEAASQ